MKSFITDFICLILVIIFILGFIDVSIELIAYIVKLFL